MVSDSNIHSMGSGTNKTSFITTYNRTRRGLRKRYIKTDFVQNMVNGMSKLFYHIPGMRCSAQKMEWGLGGWLKSRCKTENELTVIIQVS